jgi:mannose-6-phosphate isomerase-like protein (cupin superfamily)
MSIVLTAADRQAVARRARGLDIVLSGEATAGALSVLDCQVPAATAGPPLHVHPEGDETFLVTEGRLLVLLDGRLAELGPGGVAHVSRGVAHTFATPPGESARFLTVHTPAGFEEFHAAAARAEQERGRPLETPELIELASGFDWRLAGPPLLPTGKLAGPPR